MGSRSQARQTPQSAAKAEGNAAPTRSAAIRFLVECRNCDRSYFTREAGVLRCRECGAAKIVTSLVKSAAATVAEQETRQ